MPTKKKPSGRPSKGSVKKLKTDNKAKQAASKLGGMAGKAAEKLMNAKQRRDAAIKAAGG